MSKEALIIFTKNPEAGKVKTRLAATIGDAEALRVYKQLLMHTVSETNLVSADKYVFYANYVDRDDIWDDKRYYKELQQGNDLGERIMNAFRSTFKKGYDKIIIIGTDCPSLDQSIIQDAFSKLDDIDIVIGPALDGGYYLLGMKQCHKLLFKNIQWSTPEVFPETINRCKIAGLLFFLLQPLQDIDEEKDLQKVKLKQI